MSDTAPAIALITDFGYEDAYVRVMKGVIAERCSVPIIDLTHGVGPQNVGQAAYLLSTAYRFLPEGTVTVCVVDPGIGTKHEPIAVRWPGGYFVGPDNGWLSYVIRDSLQRVDEPGSGTVPASWQVVALENASFQLPAVSRTFRGRDIFAPAAAALASGTPLAELGSPRNLIATIEIARVTDVDGTVRGRVIHIDHFGNLITDIPASFLPSAFTVSLGGGTVDGPVLTYQSDEALVALVGSGGHLEISAPNGNAARLIMVGVGDPVGVTARGLVPIGSSPG